MNQVAERVERERTDKKLGVVPWGGTDASARVYWADTPGHSWVAATAGDSKITWCSSGTVSSNADNGVVIVSGLDQSIPTCWSYDTTAANTVMIIGNTAAPVGYGQHSDQELRLGGSLNPIAPVGILEIDSGDIWDHGNGVVIDHQHSSEPVQHEPDADIPSLIHKIRRLTGFTWEQVAKLVGVSRRAVHLWLSGGRIGDRNYEKLGKILALIEQIDRGNAEENRTLLLSQSKNGRTFCELLSVGEFELVQELAGKGQGRPDLMWAPVDHDKAPIYGAKPLGKVIQATDETTKDAQLSDKEMIVSKPKRRSVKLHKR